MGGVDPWQQEAEGYQVVPVILGTADARPLRRETVWLSDRVNPPGRR
jgi:hypothetical protein